MWSLYKKELKTFFSQLSGGLIIIFYLIANSAFLWLFSSDYNILDSGFAQMDGLFSLSPFIFLIFIPSLTMRLFSDEKKDGTIELLKTLPLSNLQLVLSKYLAGLSIVILAISPTFIYYFSIYQLSEIVGNVDSAGIIGSYLGLILLASVFVSIGVFTSSITKNQITSYVLAILISALFYLGFELIATEIVNGKLQLAIQFLGIDYHYMSLGKGLIDSRNVVYFISLNYIFIHLTVHRISKAI